MPVVKALVTHTQGQKNEIPLHFFIEIYEKKNYGKFVAYKTNRRITIFFRLTIPVDTFEFLLLKFFINKSIELYSC